MLAGDMLRRSAERFPNKSAILWNGTSLCYRDLNLDANRLANTLIAEGLPKGGKVGIIRPATARSTGLHSSASRAPAWYWSMFPSFMRRMNWPMC